MQSTKKFIFSMLLVFASGVLLTLFALSYALQRSVGSADAAVKLFSALTIINNSYVDKVDSKKVIDGAINGAVKAVDDVHSAYITGDMFNMFMAETKGVFGGIGVVVGVKDGKITVVAPIEGSPGALAGIKSGDKIIKIDGNDISSLSLEEAVGKIRGPKGSEVVLTLQNKDNQERDVRIIRDNIKNKTVAGKMLDADTGYIRIAVFNEHTADEFNETLKELDAKGMKNIVLDLRDNPGGLLDVCIKIANKLIPKGTVVSLEYKDGKKETFTSTLPETKYKLAVLVNKGSASASEILAGAIQDTKVGVLVGSQTYGKGSAQTLFKLGNDSLIKVTTAKYFTPAGQSINGIGLKPNYVVELKDEVNDNQLQEALSLLNK